MGRVCGVRHSNTVREGTRAVRTIPVALFCDRVSWKEKSFLKSRYTHVHVVSNTVTINLTASALRIGKNINIYFFVGGRRNGLCQGYIQVGSFTAQLTGRSVDGSMDFDLSRNVKLQDARRCRGSQSAVVPHANPGGRAAAAAAAAAAMACVHRARRFRSSCLQNAAHRGHV